MNSKSLKGRIILISVVITILLVVALSISNNLTQQEMNAYHSDRAVKSKFVLWRKIVNEQISAMEAELFALTRNKAALKALSNKDHEGLATAVKPMFNRLSATNTVSALQVTDASGSALYSSSLEIGTVANELVNKALNSGRLERGIVRNPNGQIYTAFVFPIYSKPGHPIGCGVLLNNLQPILKEFKRNDQAEVFVLDKQGKLIYQTDSNLLSQVRYELPEAGQSSLSVAHAKEGIYSIAIHPIGVAEYAVPGYVVSLNEFTENYTRLQSIKTTSWLTIVVLVVFALGVLYWFMQRSMRPLDTVLQVMESIAGGDLTNKIEVRTEDEIGQLLKAAKRMQSQLRDMVANLVQVSEDLEAGSGNLSIITDKTKQGVDRQLKETDMVATAMTEMAATVQEVALNAGEAANAAGKADDEAKAGQDVVNKSIVVINQLASDVDDASNVILKLEQESNAISSVLDVIKAIAEQTNLLALNAAIEAARAGEQGRGFAVVADEVRTLANRTQQSTAEIHEIIEKLQTGAHEAVKVMEKGREQARSSVEQAELSGRSLSAITETVAVISEMNTQIAAAAEEQSAVAVEINRNVVSISEIADSSSKGAEETGNASAKMTALSDRMQQLTQQFRV